MAFWFGRFSLFVFLLSNSSAEVCAGSLAPGCWILGILSQVYRVHGCHLACLVRRLWRPGGPWGDLGTILGHWGAQERTLWGPGLDFNNFFIDLGDPFRKCFGCLVSEKTWIFISISRLFFLFCLGSESGSLGLENQAFGKGGIEKINFRRNGISHDSRVHFSWFLLPWRVAWNLMTFQRDSGVTPDPATILAGGKCVGSRALVTTIPGSLKPILKILRPRLEVLILRGESMGYMTDWKRDCKRSFAAWWPIQGRRADLKAVIYMLSSL